MVLHWVSSLPFRVQTSPVPSGGRYGIALGTAIVCRIYHDCQVRQFNRPASPSNDTVRLQTVLSYLRLVIKRLTSQLQEAEIFLSQHYSARIQLAATPLIFDSLVHDGYFQQFTPYEAAMETSYQDLSTIYCKTFTIRAYLR